MDSTPVSDLELHRYLRAIEQPYFSELEGTLYEPTGYADVALAHVAVVPDMGRNDVRTLTPAAAQLVRLLHWLREPLPGSRLARWDGVLTDRKENGHGLASAFMEEMTTVVLANVEALIVLNTSPRTVALGPLSVSSTHFPDAALAAHYRAIIEAAATFVWVGSGDDQQARLNIVRLLREQLSKATSVDGSHPVNNGQLEEFISSLGPRWFYTAEGNTSDKKHAEKQDAPGFEKRVRDILDDEGARAWKRFSNVAHGSVAWSQVFIRHQSGEGSPGPGLMPESDWEQNIAMVHHALRKMFAEAVRILEPETTSS